MIGAMGPSYPTTQPRHSGANRWRGGRWLVVATAVIAGVAGFVLGGRGAAEPGSTSQPLATLPSTAISVPPSTAPPVAAAEAEAATLEDRIPGFDGILVLEVGSDQMLRWASNRMAPVVQPVPEGWVLEAQPGARLFAKLGQSASPDSDLVVYVGPIGDLRPARFDVDSVMWHRENGRGLAWLEVIDVSWRRVVTGEVDPSGRVRITDEVAEVPGGGVLLAWDSQGFLIRESPDVYRLSSDGTEIWRESALDAVVASNGAILLVRPIADTDAYEYLVMPAGGEGPPEVLPWAPARTMADFDMALWSPEADRLAFVVWEGEPGACCATTRSLELWTVDGTQTDRVRFAYRAIDLEWSPDGRFVLVSATDNREKYVVLFYDTVDGSIDEVEFDGPIGQVFVATGR